MKSKIVEQFKTKVCYNGFVVHNEYDHIPLSCTELQNQWYCGYVEIPEDHPLYNVDYSSKIPGEELDLDNMTVGKRSSIDILCMAGGIFHIGNLFDVHGGVTFSGKHKLTGDKFLYGFDCHHCDDDYRVEDSNYTKNEVESLAQQLFDYHDTIKKLLTQQTTQQNQ